MIVEVGRQVQSHSGDLREYLQMLNLPPRTYRQWLRSYAAGTLVPPAPTMLSLERLQLLKELREKMRALNHRYNCTHGLELLWKEYGGKGLRRKEFRVLAREVRREVMREIRNGYQRYEFATRDVCHSLDHKVVPAEIPYGPKRYFFRIMDERVRLTLSSGISMVKGAAAGIRWLNDHLKRHPNPLVFKYDREFDHPQFEGLLVARMIVPMPSPAAYPPFNGKMERTNRDVQMWIEAFGPDWYPGYDELSQEAQRCLEEHDEYMERPMFEGRTRRQAYDEMQPPTVDRERFFRDADELRRSILNRPGKPVYRADAWRIAAKETLKRYGLVKYSRP
jgi:hypothetical protein